MAKGGAGSNGEYEHHIIATRLRLIGAGNFRQSLEDLSAIQTQNLKPIPMSTATRIEPMALSNFQSQRTRLIGQVTDINEWFEISRVIIWAKPVAAEYPI